MAFLTETQKELLNRFKIGDSVRILVRNGNEHWAHDWANTEFEIVGIEWNKRTAKSSLTLVHDDGQITDGFEVHDLVRA